MLKQVRIRLVKNLFINPWIKKTLNWNKDDWISYMDETFDRLKKTRWTRRAFPELYDMNYEDLDNYKVIDEYPAIPSDYPKYLEWSSSGSVKRKVIRLTRNDAIMMIRTLGRFANNIGVNNLKNILGITSVSPFATEKLITFGVPFLAKKTVITRIYELDNNIKKIIKHAKYDGFVTLIGFLLPFLEKVVSKHDIFYDNVAIGLTGDVLTDSIVKKLDDYLSKWISNYRIYNIYACAEAGILAASHENYHELIYYPDAAGIRVLSKGRLIDILKANKGTVGEAVLTIFRELLIPNFKLGDLIEVIGQDSKTKLPIISVLGKEVRRISMDLPTVGEVSGISGAVLRAAGAPLNTRAFDSVLAELGVDYLVIIDDYKLKAKFRIYTDKKINQEDFFKLLMKNYITRIWVDKYRLGIVDFEFITDRELLESYREFMIKLTRERMPYKLPKIILRRHD